MTDRSFTPQSEGWALGPDGWKDVVAYVTETPDLAALLVELGVYDHLEHHSDECEDKRDSIFTIANHWRERELRIRTPSESVQTITVSRSLAERTEAMFRSVDPEGHIAQEWKEAIK